jgi:hypothetical protein
MARRRLAPLYVAALVRTGHVIAAAVLCVVVSSCSDPTEDSSTHSTLASLPTGEQSELDRDNARCEAEIAEHAPGAQMTGAGRTIEFVEPFESPTLDGAGLLCNLAMPGGAWAWIALADSGAVVTFVESGDPLQYCPPLDGVVPTDAAGIPLVGPTC